MPGRGRDTLDDVQVMGVWNFTIQPETPLVWLKTGILDRYLLHFTVHVPAPAKAGLIFHAEADGSGAEGVTFWMDRRLEDDGSCWHRYVLAGDGVDSKPCSTRKFPNASAEEMAVDVEVLVQGATAVVLLQNRKVKMSCRTKPTRGSLAFYNGTKVDPDGDHDAAAVHFSGIRITALRRGPLEVDGALARRERLLAEEPEPQPLELEVEDTDEAVEDDLQKASRATDSTWAPESSAGMQFAQSEATSFHNTGSMATSQIPARQSSAPGRTTRRPPSHGISTASGPFGRGKLAATQPRLRHSASDSTLRKNGLALCGLTAAGRTRGSSDDWMPFSLNATTSQKQLMKDTHPKVGRAECADFIRM